MADYNWDYGVEYEPEYWAGDSPSFDASAGGWGYDPSTMAFSQNPLYEGGTPSGGGWGYDPSTGQFSQAPLTGQDYTTGGGGDAGWLQTVLGSIGGFLGKNAGTIGPLLSGAGSLAGGAIGSNASAEAARLQADALNRGIDLQTAQWLQQQANQAPWLQAGQQALGQLQGLTGQAGPPPPSPSAAISGANYALPGTTPGWTPQAFDPQAYRWTPGQGPQARQYGYQGPQAVQAGDYRWTPGQGPSAANYRYQPGQTPDAAQYASAAPQLYQGAMPGTQVASLTGQQVLDQDPGAAFRQTEARKALEGSAAARGGLLSGSTLGALQRQSQDLASQEYGNAWQRMMSRDVEQYGRNWGQYQQAWNQGVQGTQLGLQTNAQNFGQAMSAAQLREQLQQVATQQGWSQAQTEAAYRDQMGQLASQQGFQQALGAQGQQWQQGMAGQQYDWQRAQQEAAFREQMAQTGSQQGFQQALAGQQWNQGQQQQWQQEQYARQLQDAQTRYGWDTAQNATDYQRQQSAYQQQLADLQRQWGQFSTLAGYGQTATNQVGNQGLYANEALGKLLSQLGTAQGTGAAGEGLAWTRALGGATNQLPSILASLNA